MKYLLPVFIILIITSCSSSPRKETKQIEVETQSQQTHQANNHPQAKQSKQNTPDHSVSIKAKLLAQHHEWQGTRYKYGGLSKQGVDCSGFVFLTFRNQFSLLLPRSTREQVNVGRKIEKHELITGDLVFFKRNKGQRHVGIYLSNSQFLHASTSRGVTISSMNDNYWARRYWVSKRIIN